MINFAQLNNLDDFSSFIFGELDRWQGVGGGGCHLKQEEQVSEKNRFTQIETEMLWDIQDVEQSAG